MKEAFRIEAPTEHDLDDAARLLVAQLRERAIETGEPAVRELGRDSAS